MNYLLYALAAIGFCWCIDIWWNRYKIIRLWFILVGNHVRYAQDTENRITENRNQLRETERHYGAAILQLEQRVSKLENKKCAKK